MSKRIGTVMVPCYRSSPIRLERDLPDAFAPFYHFEEAMMKNVVEHYDVLKIGLS